MSHAVVTLHDVDRMRRRNVHAEKGKATLFYAGKGWMWVAAISNGSGDSLSIEPAMEMICHRYALEGEKAIRAWIFEATGAVWLSGIPDNGDLECLAGSLPNPLDRLATGSDAEKSALADMVGRICGKAPLAAADRVRLSEIQACDLLTGGAAIAHRLGFFATETQLLDAALEIGRSPNLLRRLSHAHACACDYPNAITAAEKALEAQPELAEGPFRKRLEELTAYCHIANELRGLTTARPRSTDRGGTVAYCLHNAVPHAQGGYAIRSHALARAIQDQGQPLIAFARPGFPSDGEAPDDEVNPSTQVDDVPYRFENGFGLRRRAYGYIAEAADYFERVFTAHDIGIVHAATNFWTGLPAAIAAHRLGLPFVYEVRSFWTVTREARLPGFSSSPEARRDDELEAMVLALADQVLTLNEAMRDKIVEMGVEADRITLAPNCVDPDAFKPCPADNELAAQFGLGPDDIAVGYMGAMLGYEGIDLLVEAIAPLIREDERIRLLIVGANPEKRTQSETIEHELGQQIKRLGMARRIILVDRVPPATARQFYTLFDICAYPRRAFEVCELVSPLKPLEAMAAGKTVIGSDVWALQDLIDHDRTGLLFAKDDAEELRAVLSRAIRDQELRVRLANAARSFVKSERDWKRIARHVDAVYRRADNENAFDGDQLETLIVSHFPLNPGAGDNLSAFAAVR